VPKVEILQVLIPGVFGFRQDWHMYENDQPQADQYWGTIGANGGGFWRLVGTGFYAGVSVVMIALWAIFQSLSRRGSTFTQPQRRSIWFWSIVLVVSALMAFGRNAPFYQFFYALPYASSIRNPQKFMHVFSWAMVILFAYGVHGLALAYMQNPVARVQGMVAQFKSWLARALPFERKWMIGSFIAIAQGKLPQEHWFSLGRSLTNTGGGAALLSWSGSIFEYLMPLLVMPTYEHTLLDETYRSVVQRRELPAFSAPFVVAALV